MLPSARTTAHLTVISEVALRNPLPWTVLKHEGGRAAHRGIPINSQASRNDEGAGIDRQDIGENV